MGRAEKEEKVRLLAEKLASYTATLLTDYQGLDVGTITELRHRFRASEVEFRVVKNTLAKLAAGAAGIPDLAPLIEGPTAYAFSQDPIAPARIVAELSRAHPQLRLKGGVVDMKVVTAEEATMLATLPSLEVLQAAVAGRLKAPLYALTYSLGAMLQMLVRAVDEIRKHKEVEPAV